MLTQIIPMALYMIVVLYSICFAGEYFFPEPNPIYRFDGKYGTFVYPGRLNDWDGSELFSKFEHDNTVDGVFYTGHGASRHLSNVFNIFVVMAIFNLFNVS